MISYQELRQYRGAYVELHVMTRRTRTLVRGQATKYADWKMDRLSGLLSFTRKGIPTLNGEQIEEHGFLQVRVNNVEVVFRPSKNALRYICQSCSKDHPLTVALKDARIGMATTSSSSKHCNVCGNAPTAYMNALNIVPSKFLKYDADTSHDVIEKEMISEVFMRKMTDHNTEFYLYSVGRSMRVSESDPFHYVSIWNSSQRHGSFVRAIHTEPLMPEFWSGYYLLKDIKQLSIKVWIDNELIYEAEPEVTSSG